MSRLPNTISKSETFNLVKRIAQRRSLSLTSGMSSEERKNLIEGFGADKDIPCIDSSNCSESSSSTSDLSSAKDDIHPQATRGERFYRRPCFIEHFDDDEEPEILKGELESDLGFRNGLKTPSMCLKSDGKYVERSEIAS